MNKKIAQNTLYLYIRMIIVTLISLLIVRKLLNELGVTNYGIYNVVGGIVTMLSFISSSMTSATLRFFSVELGKDNLVRLKETYNTSKAIFILLSLITFIIIIILGTWLINNKLNIPVDSIKTAHYVLLFSLVSFSLSLIAVPDRSLLIANENMKLFSFFSILEVLLKLFIVFCLSSSLFSDKLKSYVILLACVSLLITLCYKFSSVIKSKMSIFWLKINQEILKDMASYSGWSIVGSLSYVLKNQGVNILLNIFFGPIVNASRGIALQVSSVLNNFVLSISQAVNPQIIKEYSKGNKCVMYGLVFKSTKAIYLLSLIIALPILYETKQILSLWLGEIPNYAIIFCRLVIIDVLVNSFSNSLSTSVLATGRIRNYQLLVGGAMLLSLPISYIFLTLGYEPYITLVITVIMSTIALIIRLVILQKLIQFPIGKFIREVVLSAILITALVNIILYFTIPYWGNGLIRIPVVVIIAFSSVCILGYAIGITRAERTIVNDFFLKKINN